MRQGYTLTNNHNLPMPLYRDIAKLFHAYDGDGDALSCTTVIGPAYQAQQIRKQRATASSGGVGVVIDVANLLDSYDGNVWHARMEDEADSLDVVERRYHVEVDGQGISGKIDRWRAEDGCLIDYKKTSIWKFTSGDWSDAEKQLNVLAFLMANNGGPAVTRLQVHAWLKGWKASEAEYKRDYPDTRIQVIDIPLWDPMQTEMFLSGRIQAHLEASPPPCTTEEVWADPDIWAVMKTPDSKRCVNNGKHESEAAAIAHAKEVGPKAVVDHRVAVRKRCQSYCDVSTTCPFYVSYLKEQTETV